MSPPAKKRKPARKTLCLEDFFDAGKTRREVLDEYTNYLQQDRGPSLL